MKRVFRWFFPAVLAMVLLNVGPLNSAEMPGANVQDVWNYITKVSPYHNWGAWPDHQGMQAGRAPHGPFNKVYVNETALKAVNAPPLPYGSIVVKESYSREQKLVAITVMYKVMDYNPKDGNWFWAKYAVNGEPELYGKPGGCIACHGTRARNDFVLVHDFK